MDLIMTATEQPELPLDMNDFYAGSHGTFNR
jgi:hypothetical protein